MSLRYRTTLAAIGVLLISGIVCHLLARDTHQLDAAVARVALVPKVIGDWHAEEEAADEESFAHAGARGHWTRVYVNERTKQSILAILMCGRPGKMAVHTPEVCYGGAGYELHNEAAPVTFKKAGNEPLAQFWTAQFTKKAGTTTSLRLYWAWNARGPWEASPAPRWQYRGEAFLYKLYVSRDSSKEPSATAQTDPAAGFLRQFVPVLEQTLFGEPGA